MSTPRSYGLLLAAMVLAGPAAAQQCPDASAVGRSSTTAVESLEGTLVFHDTIRKWFELKLDRPQCGQESIQLIPANEDQPSLEPLRACRVKSKGALDLSPTGYFSLDIYQAVAEIEPVGACTRKPPLPDYSKAIPDQALAEYRVDMRVNYLPGDHPIMFRVSSRGKELKPWQAYASYMLTGGFVLYGYCGKGFVVDKVFGTPQANPFHFAEARSPEDAAAFDPERAASSGKTDLHLGYTCVREW